MRRSLLVLLLASSCFAQQPAPAAPPTKGVHLPPVPKVTSNVTERLLPVSHSDLYCSGFLAKAPASTDTYIAGGLNSPNQTRFHTGDLVFLHGNYQPNTRVSFVRQTKDPNRWDAFEGQTKALKENGDIFADLGYAVVIEQRGTDTFVAQVEFSCDAIVPGDYVVPFQARQEFTYRTHTTVDRFPEKVDPIGRIIAARDFDQYVGMGRKVYLDIGTNKGLKAGDMLLAVTSYDPADMDQTDRYELKTAAIEETRKTAAKMPKDIMKQMPQRVVGELVVLSAQEHSATAMVTFSLSEIQIGDRVMAEPANVTAQSTVVPVKR